MFIYLREDYLVSYYIIKSFFFVATLELLVVLRMGINFAFFAVRNGGRAHAQTHNRC